MTDIKEAQGLEVVGYFFQHEETGQVMSVDTQQVEWGFEKNNQRLVNMGAICRLSDADARDAQRLAVIDQLTIERDAARESMIGLDEITEQQSELITQLREMLAGEVETNVSLRNQLHALEERAAELERLAEAISNDCNTVANERNDLRAELAALKSAPVVMPERQSDVIEDPAGYDEGWNACLDEFVARLNRKEP